MNLSLSRHPQYPAVLSILRGESKVHSLSSPPSPSSQPPQLLDIGCCLGQDLRKLVFDGIPSSQLIGLDLQKGFIELGYELFRDRGRFDARFCVADMLTSEAKEALAATSTLDPQAQNTEKESEREPTASDALLPLSSLRTRFSVVAANSFFHLFNYADQLTIAVRVAQLMRPVPGVLILGRQMGSVVPGEYPRILGGVGTRFGHDPETFKRFWQVDVARELAKETGEEWKFRVEADFEEEELGQDSDRWGDTKRKRLAFGVWRQ